MDEAVYRNFRDDPRANAQYLAELLALSGREKIASISILEKIETNTSLAIKLEVRIESGNGPSKTRRFFIKSDPHDRAKAYAHVSLKEVDYYRLIMKRDHGELQLARCYDAFVSEDRKRFMLLLDDVSDRYRPAEPRDLASIDSWVRAARSLAQLQAASWNLVGIAQGDVSLPDRDSVKEGIEGTRRSFETFGKSFAGTLGRDTIERFGKAVEISCGLEVEECERIDERRNITLRHGDSHMGNIMFPKSGDGDPLVCDFQFWGAGIGVGDVAHLTRTSRTIDKEMHEAVVREYYDNLRALGIQAYSWEECWTDYRKQVACMLLIPMWQNTGFGLGIDEWRRDIPYLLGNFEALGCMDIEQSLG